MEREGIAMDSSKRVVELEDKCVGLEAEKTNLIGQLTGLKAKNESLKEKHIKLRDECAKMERKHCSEQSKWREERRKIGQECDQLLEEKNILDIDVKAAEAEVKRLKGLLEQRDGPVNNLLGKIEALERQNSKLESDLEAEKNRSRKLEKALLDLKSLCEEQDGGITMLGREKRKIRDEFVVESSESVTKYMDTTSVFHKNKHRKAMGDGISECSGKNFEAERIDISNALEAERREMEKARKKINELSEMVADLEAGKEAEESEKRAMENEHKMKVLELSRSIEVLEGEKREVEARLIQATRDYREDIKRISDEKITAEAEKKAMKDESEREVSEQACKIKVLECQNREMEAELSEAKREKTEEIKRILNEMTALKDKLEAKDLELISRIDKLEREKKEVEDEACKAMMTALKDKNEKDEQIKRILNEKVALKEQHYKEFSSKVKVLERELAAKNAALMGKNSELVTRVAILEREKRELETQNSKNSVQPNEGVVAKKAATKMAGNKYTGANSEKEVQLPHQVHPMSSAGISLRTTSTTKNQGCKSVDLPVRKQKRRKGEDLGCPVSNQAGIKRSKSGQSWATPQEMLNAFTKDHQLCMRSICALYRKHKKLGHWKGCVTPCIINNGFMPPYETSGMDLGELLTKGDPEGRLKMSVAELKQEDPCGIQNCMLIARHHYMELFEIHSKNQDPLMI